ncbi:hypothetical protein EJ110_NYTH09120 [Nymphaea thermarum]|nr:hypothetical protein EJ110_NYTH09120 [Nymphaea thermarum]
MGIAGRGKIAYMNGRKIEPTKTNVAWDTWFLEDNQVKTWIVNSVSPEIQPLILRKRTARDMWVILEQMYGQKKKVVQVYQLMKDVYFLYGKVLISSTGTESSGTSKAVGPSDEANLKLLNPVQRKENY